MAHEPVWYRCIIRTLMDQPYAGDGLYDFMVSGTLGKRAYLLASS